MPKADARVTFAAATAYDADDDTCPGSRLPPCRNPNHDAQIHTYPKHVKMGLVPSKSSGFARALPAPPFEESVAGRRRKCKCSNLGGSRRLSERHQSPQLNHAPESGLPFFIKTRPNREGCDKRCRSAD